MATYTLRAADGRTFRVQAPDDISQQELIKYANEQLIQQQLASIKKPEEATAGDSFKQFAKTFGLQAAPVAGGIAGATAAAEATLALGAVNPLIPLAAGVVGGIGGAFLAGTAQDKVIESMPDTAKALGIDEESLAKGREQAPWATKSAEIAAQLVAFKPSLKGLQSTKDLADELAQEIWKARRIAAANAAIGAVTSAGQQAMAGQPLDLQSIAESAAMGAVLQNPTRYGRMLERAGRAVVPERPAPERKPLKDITEQQRLPFGGEQMEMDLGPVPQEIAKEYPDLFVPEVDKNGKPTGKFVFRTPETEVSPDQMGFDFEAPAPAEPRRPAPREIEVPLEDEATGQMGFDFRAPVAPMRGEQMELPFPGQQEMFRGRVEPEAPVEPPPADVYEPRNKLQRELDFAAMQQQELPLTLPRTGQMDMFEAGEPLPPPGRLPEPAAEAAPEAPTKLPGQMSFDLPGTPIKDLSPRDQILRAFQISRIHTDKELRSATDLPYKDYIAEINKLKKEGAIERDPSDRRWVLTKPPEPPKAQITEQQALPLTTAEGQALPPGGRVTEPVVKASEAPQEGEQLGFDFGARTRRGRKPVQTTVADTGADRTGVAGTKPPGESPAAGVGGVKPPRVEGVGRLAEPTAPREEPVTTALGEQDAPGTLVRKLEAAETKGKTEPYFGVKEEPTKPPITLPKEEGKPVTDTVTPRAVSALEEGNLGKALYALVDEAGGTPRGGQTPLPHAPSSPLRDLARALFNTVERTDDRSAIIAAEQKRYARDIGRELTDNEKNAVADLINNDYDLTKYDFTDVDGNLTDAGRLVQNFKPEYERLIPLPKGVKYDRKSGEFVNLAGKRIPASSFGGARVVVEKPQLRGEDKSTIARLKSENKVAEYDPKTNTFYFTRNGLNDRVILHEMVHAATVKVLRQFETNPESLTTRQREGAQKVHEIFNATRERLGGKFKDAFENVYEFVSHASTDAEFQKALSDIPASEVGVTPRSRMRTMWDSFTSALAKMFKLDKYAQSYGDKEGMARARAAETGDNVLLQSSMAIKDILAVPKKGLDLKALAAKAAEKERTKTIKEIQDRLATRTEGTSYPKKGNKTALLRSAWEAFATPQGRERMITNVQNYARAAKTLQDNLRRGGVQNFLYDNMTQAGAIAETKFMQMQGLREDLNTAIEKYLQSSKVDFDQFLKDFHLFALARDEAEYRKAKFLVNAPLEAAAAAERDTMLKKMGEGVDKATAKQYRDRLEQLVRPKDQGGALDPMGDSKLREKLGPKPMSVDIDSPLYNVAGPYTKEELGNIQNFYRERMSMYGSEIEPIFTAMKKIQNKTIELNKEAGYHPPQLDAIIEFYRRPNYVPYKGDPNLSDANAMFDVGGKRLSGNLSELQDKAEGRNTDSENPLLQVLADAAKAAGRVGRRDVAEETIRLINQGDIQGKKVAEVPFSERFAGLVNKEDIEGSDRIFRHMPDGTVEVYKISDPTMLHAIKGFTGDTGAFWQLMNRITSAVGRQHTLYNPGFAPYDYIRNMVTAGTTVGAEVSPEAGARYIKSVTTKLLDGGLFKAARFAMLHQKGDIAGMEKLKAQEGKDGFYHTLSDWLEVGGQAAYRSAFNIRSIGEELAKEVGPVGRMNTLDQIKRYFRVYSDAFEFAGRAAGYQTVLPDVLAKYKAEGRNIKSPEVIREAKKEASQYTKNIFNFNEVGTYGREAGSVFMFLRPSLTSAARFYDAFAPAMTNVESAMKLLPKSRTDVEQTYKRLYNAYEGPKDDAAKAMLRRKAEQEVAKFTENFKADFAKRKKNAQMMTAALTAMGYGLYNISMAMSPKDEEGRNKVATDNMEIWARNLRLPAFGLLGKDNDYFQLPWGWGFGSFGSFGSQVAGVVNGESTIKEMVKNTIPLVFQSAVPLPVPNYSPIEHPLTFALGTITPSFARPFLEYVTNVDAFGREIYKNRVNSFGDPYTGGETLPEMYGKLTELFADHLGVAIEPRTLFYFMNSYTDGLSRLMSMGTGVGMSALGDRNFDPKYDIPVIGSFIGKSSSFDAREFADVRKQAEELANKLDIYKKRPEQYEKFVEANPDAEAIVDMYRSQINGPLKDVQQQINEISSSPDYTSAEKREAIKELKKERDWIMRGITDTLKDYGL